VHSYFIRDMGKHPSADPAASAAFRAQSTIDPGGRVDAFLGDCPGGTVAHSRARVILRTGVGIGDNHFSSTSTL